MIVSTESESLQINNCPTTTVNFKALLDYRAVGYGAVNNCFCKAEEVRGNFGSD